MSKINLYGLENHKSQELIKKTIKNVSDYDLEGITQIKSSAFALCSLLSSIAIPNTVTTIGETAFNGCTSLTEVFIPSSVGYLGDGVFWGCSELTQVTIANNYTSISSGMFYNCVKLNNVNLGNAFSTIGEYAFFNCVGLTNINLPSTLTNISTAAFYGCTGLNTLTFAGTKLDWGLLPRGSGWHYDVPATQIYCSGSGEYVDLDYIIMKVDFQATSNSDRVFPTYRYFDGANQSQNVSVTPGSGRSVTGDYTIRPNDGAISVSYIGNEKFTVTCQNFQQTPHTVKFKTEVG